MIANLENLKKIFNEQIFHFLDKENSFLVEGFLPSGVHLSPCFMSGNIPDDDLSLRAKTGIIRLRDFS